MSNISFVIESRQSGSNSCPIVTNHCCLIHAPAQVKTATFETCRHAPTRTFVLRLKN